MSNVINWFSLLPALIVLGTAVVSTLVEAFVPRRGRRGTQVVLSLLAVAAGLVAAVWRLTVVKADGVSANAGHNIVEDGLSAVAQIVILAIAIFAVLVIADRTETGEGSFAASAATQPGSSLERESIRAGHEQTEIFPLTLFALGGMLAFPAAGDLLTLFIALEVLSLPLYVLCATARRHRAFSQEAALKYFLLGAFSSAFFLFGAALVYGYAGSLVYSDIHAKLASNSGMDFLYLAGVALVLVGLLFKVGAVPFHAWTPDVYQGAPTPVTGYMAAGTKAAAFAAMLRFLYVVGGGAQWDLATFMWIVIIATMLVGTVMGIVQKNIKRMLAYSSIAHAGFLLIGVNAFSGAGLASVMFYLLAYGLATVGAFGIVTLVRERDTKGEILGEANNLGSWVGLGKRNPLLATCMTIFLLSFAGIPLTAGFVGKLTVFTAGVQSGETILVVLAVIASAATGYFYFRLVQLMFFREPDGNSTAVVASEGLSIVAIVVCAILTIVLGILPNSVLSYFGSLAVLLP